MAKQLVDPIGLLGEIRGKLSTEALKIPAPDPLKAILGEVDQLAGRLESEIRSGVLVLQRDAVVIRDVLRKDLEEAEKVNAGIKKRGWTGTGVIGYHIVRLKEILGRLA